MILRLFSGYTLLCHQLLLCSFMYMREYFQYCLLLYYFLIFINWIEEEREEIGGNKRSKEFFHLFDFHPPVRRFVYELTEISLCFQSNQKETRFKILKKKKILFALFQKEHVDACYYQIYLFKCLPTIL